MKKNEEEFSEKPVVQVLFYITDSCNLQCKHCYISPNRVELSTNEAKEFLDQILELNKDYSLFRIVFIGGEPLLRKDIFQLISYVTSKGIRADLATNGTLLTDSIAKKLKENKITSVQISLDGLEKTHDYIRGRQGLYNQSFSALKILNKYKIHSQVMITLSKLNYDEVLPLAQKCDQEKIKSFNISRLVPFTAEMKEQCLSNEQLKYIYSNLTHTPFKNFKVNFEDPLTCITLQKKPLNTKSVCGGCTAGIATLTVSANGEVYPCRRLPISIGNINKTKLIEIWESGNLLLKNLRARTLSGKCSNCKYKSICGGCRAIAYAFNKDPLSEDPQCFL